MKFHRVIVICLASIFLFSCAANNKQNIDTQMMDQTADQTTETNQNQDEMNNGEIADHLANLATQVPDVKNANAIIAGPYAVVAIDLDETTERQRIGTIKYSVGEALREDRYGKTAVVVADADMNERVRQMTEQMKQGHPVRSIVDELADIVARYMPAFPVERYYDENMDENEQKLNPEEMEEWKEIENEQSNDRMND